MFKKMQLSSEYSARADACIFEGDCLELLRGIPDKSIQLIITSPPYNIGKEYEKRVRLDEYVKQQSRVIGECQRALRSDGHICWQVGNYVDRGSIVPLDVILFPIFDRLGMRMRNRIVWHFEHGLHCSNRFSGRYETIVWFTKSDEYFFNVDPVRVPQKYPGKRHFKGPKAGEPSGNPLGKNPGDVWVFPNVKNNHVEKTAHPCQFPVELVERFVLSMTKPGDWVLDPFLGVGTTIAAAILHNRKGIGAEIVPQYADLARERCQLAWNGALATRSMHKPVFNPKDAGNKLTTSPWQKKDRAVDTDSLFGSAATTGI